LQFRNHINSQVASLESMAASTSKDDSPAVADLYDLV
jgi:hypothetical protein